MNSNLPAAQAPLSHVEHAALLRFLARQPAVKGDLARVAGALHNARIAGLREAYQRLRFLGLDEAAHRIEAYSQAVAEQLQPPIAFDHVWFWRSRLPKRKGQRCAIVARGGKMNSIMVQFEDGAKVVTSRWAVRKIKPTTILCEKSPPKPS